MKNIIRTSGHVIHLTGQYHVNKNGLCFPANSDTQFIRVAGFKADYFKITNIYSI